VRVRRRSLADDWTDCIIPLSALLLPFALAGMALARNSPGYLIAACVLLVPVAVLSFITGVGGVLLGAAALFGFAYTDGRTLSENRPKDS
jgi:hypothetical protein